MVRSHAQIIRRATPHLTAESLLVAPDPIMAPLTQWVVLTGMPRNDAPNITPAADVSAAKPCTGSIFVILKPIVRTILHPPERVPSAIEEYAARTTHKGIEKVLRFPVATSRAVTTPIVFCASFVPWLRLTRLEDTSWSLLKYLFTT